MEYKEFLDSIDRKAYHEGETQWQEGDYTVTRTYHYSPPGCHTSCGVLLYTKNGKLERVEGDPLDPCANGKLCVRCLTLAESVNHPDRLKYPMRRIGERGENRWERISWDEAYDEIEAKVRDIWATDGGNAIICIHGTGRNINWQVPLMGQGVLRTPNVGVLGFTGFACYLPRTVGSIAPFGDFHLADASMTHEDRYLNPEWTNPEVLVVWGNEPLASNADGYLGHWLLMCCKMGTKVISIDPRLTWWGARAEYHLQLRPGTDTALAMAMLNVIISEDLYDHEVVEHWCMGFDELAGSVKDATPEWAASICCIDAEDIEGAARLYAGAKPGCIQWGLAFDQQLSAMSMCLAANQLIAICGNLDVPGGNILVHNAFECNAGYTCGEEWVPKEWYAKKLNNDYALGIEKSNFIANASSDAMVFACETGYPYPIKMLWIQSSNALACPGMDVARIMAAMKNVPFIVNCDPYMTPTSVALADIVLPVAMSAERNSARTWWTPLRTMRAVTSFYEAKSDEQIIVDLGRRLNPDFFGDMSTDIDLATWYMQDGTGSLTASREVAEQGGALTSGKTLMKESWREVAENGCYRYDDFNATYHKAEKGLIRPDGSAGYGTPSGRIELTPLAYRAWGMPTTAFHTEPPQSPVSTPELMEEYPLILTCGGRSFEFFHSEHRQLPTTRELHPQPLCMVNPKTADKYGLKDGQWMWIENDHGRFRQVCKITERVNEFTIHAEHGWWFPETAPEELFRTFDANPNNCTKAFEVGPGGVGSSIKCMIAKVYPYKDGDILPTDQIMDKGRFDWTVDIASPAQAQADALRAAKAEGWSFDALDKTLVNGDGNKYDLTTREAL